MATDRPSIRILKPGTFTDVRGQKVTFSRADLEGAAAAYDAASDPAPLVVGHPDLTAPAYGWVGELAMEGDHLVARPREIAPAFADAVAAGHYRKVSPQLYPPAHPANPKPGSWYLQHVGFLGGAAPAIKGLGTVSFAAGDDAAPLITIEEPIVTDTPTDTIALAEHQTQIDAANARIAELETAATARAAADAAAAATARHNENVAFAEGLIAAATLAPVAKSKVVGLMDQLDAVTVVSFGEGDAAQLTPLAAFRSLFDAAHPVIALGEAAPIERGAPAPGTVTVSFAAPAGYGVAADQVELHGRAKALQAAEPGLTFWDAFTRARAEAAAA